jgi:S-adenosylmethionine/arginine decarboxylase-like enzyme
MTSETKKKEEEEKKERSPFKVSVPSRIFQLILLTSLALAFSLGRVSRSYVVVELPSAASPETVHEVLSFNGKLPIPSLEEGVKLSESRVYGSPASHWIQARETASEEGSATNDADENDEDEEANSLGQQLMLDFEFVDSQFLDSAERLSNTMIAALEKAGLDPVSYHCYRPGTSSKPVGVSCQWALSNGRASFTSWPQSSVLALDIFLVSEGEDDELLSTTLMPILEEAFSVTSSDLQKKPKMHWLLKTRGFEEGEATEADVLASSDMDAYPLAAAATYKKHIASVTSAFQTIDVFDILTDDRPLVDYEKSLAGDDSYHAQHPELFEPDRVVFMGGLLQSRRLGDAAYHEALVHPALFTHPNPRRVAIIGGGEGATLREILKHNTIDEVVMIDIDSMIVEISKEFLPGWNNCSNLVGRADSCFEDVKARVYLEDAFKWFKDRFLEGGELEGTEDPFDVIIMDAL